MSYEILQGNCLYWLTSVEDHSVDLVILDLPYKTTSNHWESRIDLPTLWTELKRVSKPTTPILQFAKQPFTTELINSNPKGYRHKWTWVKEQAGNFVNSHKGPLALEEDILVFSAHKGRGVNYYPIMRTGKMRVKGGRASVKNARGYRGDKIKNISYRSDQYFPTSILNFAGVPRTKRIHSAQKPVALLRYLIQTYSRPGDMVLDCTTGSGSTGVAALQEGRSFVGFEIDAQIYTLACGRMERLLINDLEEIL